MRSFDENLSPRSQRSVLHTTASCGRAESRLSPTSLRSALCSAPSRSASEILSQLSHTINAPMPSLKSLREQLIAAKQEAGDGTVVLPLETATKLHTALSGFVRLRESTRELHAEFKSHVLRSEDRTRQLRAKNYKLRLQLEEERRESKTRSFYARLEADSLLGAEVEGLRTANSEFQQHISTLEHTLKCLGHDESCTNPGARVPCASDDTFTSCSKLSLTELTEDSSSVLHLRRSNSPAGNSSNPEKLRMQSAALAQEAVLLKQQLAMVVHYRNRVLDDIEARKAEEEGDVAANPLDTRPLHAGSDIGKTEETLKQAASEPELTAMLVEAKVQLAEAREEAMRLRRDLRRCLTANVVINKRVQKGVLQQLWYAYMAKKPAAPRASIRGGKKETLPEADDEPLAVKHPRFEASGEDVAKSKDNTGQEKELSVAVYRMQSQADQKESVQASGELGDSASVIDAAMQCNSDGDLLGASSHQLPAPLPHRVASVLEADPSNPDNLVMQSAALVQEAALLQRQIAEVELQRARIEADLQGRKPPPSMHDELMTPEASLHVSSVFSPGPVNSSMGRSSATLSGSSKLDSSPITHDEMLAAVCGRGLERQLEAQQGGSRAKRGPGAPSGSSQHSKKVKDMVLLHEMSASTRAPQAKMTAPGLAARYRNSPQAPGGAPAGRSAPRAFASFRSSSGSSSRETLLGSPPTASPTTFTILDNPLVAAPSRTVHHKLLSMDSYETAFRMQAGGHASAFDVSPIAAKAMSQHDLAPSRPPTPASGM